MARINIDMKSASKLNSYDIIKDLQSLIQAELDKPDDEVDTDFVDECVDALLEIEQDEDKGFVALVPLISSEKFLRKITNNDTSGWKSLNRFARIAIVAAVLAGSTFTVNAAVASATGVNVLGEIGEAVHNKLEDIGLIKTTNIDQFDADDDDGGPVMTTASTTAAESTTETAAVETTTQASTTKAPEQTTKRGIDQFDDGDDDNDETSTTETQPATEAITKPISKPSTTRRPAVPTTAEPVTKPQPGNSEEAVLTGLKAEFDDHFRTDYIYGESLSYDGLILKAVYSDGSEKEVALSDCDYTRSINMNTTADYTLRIIYEGCIVTIDITVRPDEDTRGSEICSNDLYDYLLTDRGAYVTAYHGDETNINLDYVDGNEVIAIGSDVFAGSNVEYIIAQNVQKIFPNAFNNCTQLVDCYTPSAVYVGDNAFDGCTSLLEAVYSDNLTYLGISAYKSTAIERITVPSAITVIPASLCEACTSLKSVRFMGEVTKVSAQAFMDCTALETVTGTQMLKEAGASAFSGDKLVNFDYPLDNLEIAGAYAFDTCQKLETGTLPSIKEIDNGSFCYCYLLTEFTVPECMTEIPYAAFIGTRLAKVNFHDNVTAIGDFAFMSTPLTEVYLPKNLKSIGTRSLFCTRMRSVYFSNYNVEIDETAFYFGTRLTFYVYANSTALYYAKDNDINYEIIDDPDVYKGVDQLLGEDD